MLVKKIRHTYSHPSVQHPPYIYRPRLAYKPPHFAFIQKAPAQDIGDWNAFTMENCFRKDFDRRPVKKFKKYNVEEKFFDLGIFIFH